MTRIFYLVVASLTLWAAAAQWLPREGLPTHLDFGPEVARAQAPDAAAAIFPSSPIVPPPAANDLPSNGSAQSKAAFDPPPVAATGPVSPIAPYVAAASAGPTQPASTIGVLQPPLSTTGSVAWTPSTQELEGAKVLARVGGDVILAGEVIASVKGYLARNKVDFNSPEIADQREQLIKMRLAQMIETRIIVNEARRKIPEEGYKKAMGKFDEEFDKTVVPQMLKDRKVDTVQQLEALLRKEGTTLERERNSFAETILRNSWLSQSVKFDQDVTHEQMLRYYQDHIAQYEFSAQARWEQISMRFDRFPSKAEAYAALAAAGNQILDGRSFSDVAREVSQGSSAAQGGAVAWTTKGSLVSQPLDTALFSLPVDQLSPIIEDDRGFHIIRVVERKDAGRKPFTEAQVEIRKKITDQRTAEARAKFVEEIKKNAVVWTIYDEPKSGPSAGDPTRPAVENARTLGGPVR